MNSKEFTLGGIEGSAFAKGTFPATTKPSISCLAAAFLSGTARYIEMAVTRSKQTIATSLPGARTACQPACQDRFSRAAQSAFREGSLCSTAFLTGSASHSKTAVTRSKQTTGTFLTGSRIARGRKGSANLANKFKAVLVLLAILGVSLALSPTLAAHRLQPPASVAPQYGVPSSTAQAPSSPAAAPQPTEKKVTAYTLPPETYKKARDLSGIHFRFNLISFVYGIFVLWLILQLRLAPKYRDWAEKFSSKHFPQAIVFVPLFLLTASFLGLPADIYENWVERKFGISVQGWGSWAWDWTKGQFLSIALGICLFRYFTA